MNEVTEYFHSPIGWLKITANNHSIVEVSWKGKKFNEPKKMRGNKITQDCVTQLQEYFNGKRKKFNLPLSYKGTEFQTSVWKQLRRIPFGKTESYGGVAQKIGSPNGSRAVGNANNKNRHLIVVPCHRVIGANGSLTGFACGMDVKKWLLNFENQN